MDSHKKGIFLVLHLLLCILLPNKIIAQKYNLGNVFTINEGLPSNHIYDLCEDKDGFLWIATDNGIARFDGTRFVNYTTKNGLPSNDVLQVVKEKNGTIWVNCYKQPPSYFDPKNNQFVSFEDNKEILNISSSLLSITLLENGGISFQNNLGSILFIENKIKQILKPLNRFVIYDTQYNISYYKSEYSFKNHYINHINFYNEKNKKVANYEIINNSSLTSTYLESNKLYFFFRENVVRLSLSEKSNRIINKETFQLQKRLKWFKFYQDSIILFFEDGCINVYDKESFKVTNTINNKQPITVAITDSNNNFWIATSGKGLLFYNTTQIKKIPLNSVISNDYLSVNYVNNKLLAGNYYGNILVKEKGQIKIKNIISDNKIMWMRSIFSFNEKDVVLTDAGYSINYKKCKSICNDKSLPLSLKTGIKFNDSLLIIGTNNGIYQLNINNEKYKKLNSPDERILGLVKKDKASFYFIANDGVFLFNYSKQSFCKVLLNKSFANDEVHIVEKDFKDQIWMSTYKGNLIVLNDRGKVFKIPNSIGLPENMTNLLAVKNKLWIASKTGLFVLNYEKFPNYELKKITTSDGLSNNSVNDLSASNDSIYIATSNGISILPINQKFKKNNIKPYIISLKVNNEQVSVANLYDLDKNQKNILIQLASIDLTSHFKMFQYALNDKNKWIDIEGNTLNLSLTEGESKLFIRVVDVNNFSSSKIIEINFNVAIPIYNTIWFWIIISSLIIGFFFRWFNKTKFEKQKNDYKKQLALEQQRSKITADLHDEIGSTLSSLQINSTIANKLMEKDIVSAQKIIQKVENQAQSLSDKIGDIIWSMKPGKDEFMTLSTRVKNFANEILESTTIDYKIIIDQNIDTKINDITARKNIVFFIKEAINNAVKYSKASKLLIEITEENKQLIIEIVDNGVGFVVFEKKGNGIGNMEKRVKELNGYFSINSEINNGTRIKAIIPISLTLVTK